MYRKVTVAGGGVLGSQIAFQAAYSGFDVTIWLRSEGSIGRTQPKLDELRDTYRETIEQMATPEGKSPDIWARGLADPETFDKEACLEKVEKAYSGIRLELDLSKAVEDADLVIESMAELEKVHRPPVQIPVIAFCQPYLEAEPCRSHGPGRNRSKVFR